MLAIDLLDNERESYKGMGTGEVWSSFGAVLFIGEVGLRFLSFRKAISVKAAECTEEHSSLTKVKKPYSPVVCEEHNTKEKRAGNIANI